MSVVVLNRRTVLSDSAMRRSGGARARLARVGLVIDPAIAMPIAERSSSVSPSPDIARPIVESEDVSGAKFMDAYSFGCDRDFWYRPGNDSVAYLSSVPGDATTRVAAMRAKIDSWSRPSSPAVTRVAESSYRTLLRIGTDLYNAYHDPTSRDALAKYMDVSTLQIPRQAAQLDAAFRLAGGDAAAGIFEATKTIGPKVLVYLKDVSKSLSDSIGSTAGGPGSEISGFLKSTDFAAASSIFLSGAKMAIDLYVTTMAQRENDNARSCAEFMDREVVDRLRKIIDLGLPYPLHTMDACSVDCERIADDIGGGVLHPTDCMYYQLETFRWALAGFVGDSAGKGAMPIPDLAVVRRWWTLSQVLSSNEFLRKVNEALGWSAWASDEQVVMVAAPIALASGLDPWNFATELYRRSPGWRSRPDLFHREDRGTGGREDPDTGIVGKSLCWGPSDTGEPVNCWEVNFAVLCADAFALADEAKAGRVPSLTQAVPVGLLTSAAFATRTMNSGSVVLPLALGALGTGALAFAGAGLLVAAAPAALGVLWAAMSGSMSRSAADVFGTVRVGRGTVREDEAIVQVHEHDDGPDWLCPFDLFHADASRYKAWEEMLALEDHVVGDWCPDCASKHAGSAIKFLREARTLQDGSEEDVDDARALVAICPRLRTSIGELRALRKRLGERARVRRIVGDES